MRYFKRQRGFLTFAQNGEIDYLRMAYGLALSLKASQSEIKDLSVVVTPNTPIPDHYREVFDEIIDVPWLDEARDSTWKLENEWKSYHITPYEETIKLDADMLFPCDISDWWDVLGRQDMLVCTNVETYRGELITSNMYRECFVDSKLPNIYTGFMYFKYSDLALEVFKMAEMIFHNWERFTGEHMEPITRPTYVSTDVVFALAIKLVDAIQECTFSELKIPRFVHMKSGLMGWDNRTTDNWMQHVPISLTSDLILKIGRYVQTLPFHYHAKNFLTDDMLRKLENHG